jgi:hypothetical protein
MTDPVQELIELECELNALVGLRNETVHAAEQRIKQANREFDKVALPLGRRINALRKQLEVSLTDRQSNRQIVYVGPDPDWEPEDIVHYRELSRRESINKSR